MENSELYLKICKATKLDFERSLRLLDGMEITEVRRRTVTQHNTYMHLVILKLKDLHNNCDGDVRAAIPLLYKLALCGCDINAQNKGGNTVLHMACFRPYGEQMVQHLIRLGVDSGILNEMNARVIHDNYQHKAWLVRGQRAAKCSIWNAVAREDTETIEKYMTSWLRTDCRRRRKTLVDVAYDTGNYKIVQHLMRYKNTNELVCCALASDYKKVEEYVGLKSDKCNFNTMDKSESEPKPLLAEVKELFGIADSERIYRLLKEAGFADDREYYEKIEKQKTEFRASKFVALVEICTVESLQKAWHEIDKKSINLVTRDHETGGTYMHYVVKKYNSIEDLRCKRLLVKLMYKLALDGVDIHARNSLGETALVAAFTQPPDRTLLDHLICLGVDASIRSNSGHGVTINTYATRGDLVLRRKQERRLLPGLQTAVEDGDVERVKHWLGCLCRVNVIKNGRTLTELAKDIENAEITELLEYHFHISEFAIASIAGDVKKMKHHIAMGDGSKKVNSCFKYHFAGFTNDWRAEFVSRPLIASVIEYGDNEIAQFLMQFGAKLEVQYEECAPCGPVAFWAFRDDITSDVSLAIAQHADLSLRNELGQTLLHVAVMKNDFPAAKCEVVSELLDRGANVAARDLKGLTARDYCEKLKVRGAKEITQIIDDFVLNLSYVGDYDSIEQLILDGYDHINDISGTARNKTAKELAFLRYYKELLELLDEEPRYHEEIKKVHEAVILNDQRNYVKYAGEKRVAWGVDSRGRNLLHMAVLFQNHDMVAAICEQFPQMIYRGDNLLRTPVHYAVCLRDQRETLSIISTSNSVDMTAKEGNNLSVLDYIDQLERPVLTKSKTRGRREFDYQVKNLVETEKMATPEYVEMLLKMANENKEQETNRNSDATKINMHQPIKAVG